ncbi:hypothetical protein ACFPVT_06715 [Corynebacterium choanae]|uniref:Uncharacterized protein n=1 Tax=Corynebacterium choanae TaxID=1862358 RepID=A0A3G6J722_9CORY|nr:hypothetical protein [Corynebacterium choanae]AZA13776.1 hypothetical protein CCHOA_06920 [Corynebacterium choanae]
MPDPMFDTATARLRLWWPYLVVAGCCAVLIGLLHIPGVVIALLLVMSMIVLLKDRGVSEEAEALRSSIRLSAEDIIEVLRSYEEFLSSSEPTVAEDRGEHRPALADPDCDDAEIAAFFCAVPAAKRYLTRLDYRLRRRMTVGQLETLLQLTDQRAVELAELWSAARRRALRLGGNYQKRAS